jgi:hypothetical protein
MQLFAALRGDTKMIFDHYWTSLGVNRISRVGWESRLGPSDGVRDSASGRGITFAPTWMENNRWIRLADVPDRYGGWFTVQFAHPLLVRCAIEYAPTGQRAGPHFRHEFVITPDGVLATLRSADAKNFGVTWPLLENDGAALKTQIENGIVTTAYDPGADQESFIAVGESPAQLDSADAPLQSSYGWLRPVRAPAGAGLQRTFVYPRGAEDPPAAKIRENFHISDDGFESPLGKVHGSVYIGRTSAGGEAQSIDIDHDGKPDAAFDTMCKFVLQLHDGKITAVEADRAATVQIAGRAFELKPFVPLPIEPSK